VGLREEGWLLAAQCSSVGVARWVWVGVAGGRGRRRVK
jgi:hypothetical protein